nr:recombinase family protein [Oscillospiraceae bacterium]
EKYCGDCILQKTVTLDPIEKTRKANEGEAPMWLVENSHPAIIKREIFNKVQEEISRRKTYTPQSKKNATTATGKYSRFALSDVLQCGECGTRYRRVTWSKKGKKKIVWRCVNRLDYGTKYCKDSLTVEETELQNAIVKAINKFNAEDAATYLMLMRSTIGEAIGLNGGSDEIDLLERRIDALNKRMLTLVNDSVKEGGDIENHEDEFKSISEQIEQLNGRIKAIRESESEDGDLQKRLSEIQRTIDERETNRSIYDDSVVRQMIECIKVYKDGRLQIIFGGGYEIEVNLHDE